MKKTALMLADTRPALIGQMLLQIEKTNRDVFDEVIVFDTGLNDNDKALMQKLMPCRFIKYESPISNELLKRDRFKRFSLIMFARYEMFRLLNDYSLIMWMDTDMVIQGSLKELLDETAGYGFSILCEDPHNKSAKKVDYMRTNFFHAISKYNMNTYLYCTGMIIVRDCLEQSYDFTEWCYQKTLEWADNLNLPDQGVLNALTQEFKLNVKPFGNNGKYGCYPFIGRNCEDAITVHSWGTNKFWNNWYLNCKFPFWEECYREWIDMGGSTLDRTISPEISVIIPTYKPDTGYFKQCIDSLINQEQNGYESYSNYEVIIVAEPFDVEKIKEFVESYHDPRISVYFNEERLGIAASLNRGLRLARGTYIARIDDDDIAAPTRFEKQVNYLNTHPNIELCTSDYLYFGDMNDGRVAVEGEMARAWSVLTCPFDHPTLMFRRDFFVNHNLLYDENRGFVEDWELWQRAFRKGMRVGCVHDILLYHRWHNGSAGQTNKTVEMMREMIQTNFKELGVDVCSEDLYLLSPWNGKVATWAEYERLENYFREAVNANAKLKLYDALSLSRAFSMRLSEAKCGTIPELIILRENESCNNYDSTAELATIKQGKFHKIKLFLKNLLKPLYQPIRHRFQDPIIDIQKNALHARIEAQEVNKRVQNIYEDIGLAKQQVSEQLQEFRLLLLQVQNDMAQFESSLGRISEEMNEQFRCVTDNVQRIASEETEKIYNQAVGKIEQNIEKLRQELEKNAYDQVKCSEQLGVKIYDQFKRTQDNIFAKIFEQTENTRQDLFQKIYEETENTRQELSGKIYREADDTRKAVKRVWKLERTLRAGFQNVYLANCLNTHNAGSAVSMTYDDIFYFENRAGSVMSARAILSTLLPHLDCRSMVDFGCGTGTWLWVAHGFGVESIRGLDGDYVPPRQLMIPQDCFCAVDLEEPVVLEKKYDLAISMEVAEHLHKESADTFVESLCNAADTILFSAAHPGQGGDGHINEQPMTYWTSKFGKHGFLPVEIRQLFEGNEDIESWYRENIVLYVREAKARGVEKNLLGKSE